MYNHHFSVCLAAVILWYVLQDYILSLFLGINKKLLAAGKKKGCEILTEWAQSISNHTYWCAATCQGEGELLKSKWLSLLNHVADIHQGHDENFPQCEHGDLEPRKWIKKGLSCIQNGIKV